ncbi:hypothetical protein ACGFSI_34980 [Streptomyces virginiae]|uniref:hypothetical protein n=1 Tax=Streptomyces virginiae TaxID=1961 RepID=UPI0037208731
MHAIVPGRARASSSHAHRDDAEVRVRGKAARVDAEQRAQLLGVDPPAVLGRFDPAPVLVERRYFDGVLFLGLGLGSRNW